MSKIVFEVPLPPRELRLNHRAQHWAVRAKAADEYSAVVYENTRLERWPVSTIKKAAVTYTWRYAGARPDIDNIAASVKVLQDTLCTGPKPSYRAKNKSNRWYVGLVRDDGAMEPVTFKRQKVATKAEECVYVEIEALP